VCSSTMRLYSSYGLLGDSVKHRQKSFNSLSFSLKGHFSKIICMYKLHYPRLIVSMLKKPPILKLVLCSAGYSMIPRGTTFEFEYLGECKIEIKNILEHESGVHMGLIHEKNQRPKISCYCTFKDSSPMLILKTESLHIPKITGHTRWSSISTQSFMVKSRQPNQDSQTRTTRTGHRTSRTEQS
jgi:hypothetical protein